jgi:membrane-bound lytic murein transglycosylase A
MIDASARLLTFTNLAGWAADDHQAALLVFLESLSALTDPGWVALQNAAAHAANSPDGARQFFERSFQPVVIGTLPCLFTGYYEPVFFGSLVRTERFQFPIYRRPPELMENTVWPPREAIETQGLLHGRGLEIAWLESPVDVYFLMIQGSGRISLPDEQVVRVGYGGKNNQPYKSLGQELIRRGMLEEADTSAESIRTILERMPALGAELMAINPSFVFFKTLDDLPVDKGPVGTIGRSITAFRSIAIDPDFTPLGAPVWVEKDGKNPLRTLMIAQDTGSAIKGAQRGDIFYGTGKDAGLAAGAVKESGRMVVLLPLNLALALVGGG